MNVIVDNFGYILSGAAATVRLAALASVLALSVGAMAGLMRLDALVRCVC